MLVGSAFFVISLFFSTLFVSFIASVYAYSYSNVELPGVSAFDYEEGESMSVVMESETKTHFAYCNDNGDDLLYTYVDGGVTTTVEAVHTAGSLSCLVRNFSIVLNGSTPIIFYPDNLDDIVMAVRDGAGSGTCAANNEWNCYVVHDTLTADGNLSAVYDGTSYHIAFRSGFNIKYATCSTASDCTDSANWSYEEVHTHANQLGRSLSLAVKSDGTPVIAYDNLHAADALYAIRDDSGSGSCTDTDWNCYKIDNASVTYDSVAVAVDSGDKIGIVYRASSRPYFAYEDGGNGCSNADTTAFTCEEINTNLPVYPSINFHGTNPLVAWYNDTSDDLMFGVKAEGSWTIETVVSSGSIGSWSAIDRFNDEVSIGYYNTGNTTGNLATVTVAFNTAPSVTAITPSQTSGSVVTVTTTIADTDSDETSLILEYSLDNSTWVSSTLAIVTPDEGAISTSTGSITGIDTDNDGSVNLTIEWNIEADIPNTDDSAVYFRVIPYDGTDYGTTATSSAFAIDTADPTVPGALTVNATSTTSVVLNFAATSTDTNFSEYKIFYKEGSSGVTTGDTAFTSSSDANLGSATFSGASTTTISGLSVNTQYTANLFAYDTWGNVTSSASEITFYTLANAPGTPTVSGSSTTSLDIVINTNSNPANTTYALHFYTTSFYVSAAGSPTTTPIYQTSSTWGGAVTATYLSINSQYAIDVYAKNGDGLVTAASSYAGTYTHANPAGTPTVNGATTSTLDITLDANSNPTSTTYAIYESSTGNYVASDLGLDAGSAVWQTTSTWNNPTITGLTPNTEYTFQVISRSNAGVLAATTTASAVYTLANAASTPTIGTPTASTLPITIDVNSNPAATTYVVYNDTDGTYLDTAGAATTTAVYSTTSTLGASFAATGLTPNTSYQFAVIARNGDNTNTATSTASTATYTLANSASAPTILGPKTTSTLPITINVNGNPSATTFAIYNDTDGNYLSASGSSNGGTPVYQTNADWTSSFYAVSLTPNTSYQFSVVARNGDSINSATSTASTAAYTLASVPAAPTVTGATTSSIGVVVNTNSNSAATTYALHVYDTNYFVDASGYVTTTAVYQASSSWNGITLKSLSINDQYGIDVVAKNGDGVVTATSSPVAAYTLANPAGALSVTASSTSSFDITLNENGNPAATTYAIHVYGTSLYVDSDGSTTSSAVYQTTSTWTTPVNATGYNVNDNIAFEIIARNGDGIDAATTTASAVYTLANPANTPTIGTPTTSTLPITIDVNSNPAATTYAVYNNTDSTYLDTAGAATTTAVYSTTSTLGANFAAIGLSLNTAYQFTVTARNGDGVNAATSTASTATYTLPASAGTPTVSSITSTTLSLAFADSSNAAGTVYSIYNATDESIFSTTTATSSVSITSLTPNTSYQFSVISEHAGGGANAATSTASTATTTLPAIPNTPTTVANGQTSVIVSWTANNNPAATVYEVYNITDSAAFATTTATSTTVTSLTAATSYTFKIRGQSSGNSSVYSAYSSASEAVSTEAIGSPVSITLSVGESSTFQLSAGGNSHTITLDAADGDAVTTTIQSDPVTSGINEGSSTNIDSDGDGAEDMTVEATTVNATSATITLTSYTPPVSESSVDPSGGGGFTPSQPKFSKSSSIDSTPPTTEIVKSSVNIPHPIHVGGSSHTLTILNADSSNATVLIQSDPITLTLEKYIPQDIDTNKDNINDLRVAYLGLIAAEPQVALVNLTDEGELGQAMTIHAGSYETNSADVQLSFNVDNASEMAISNESDFSGKTFIPYKSSYNWKLTEGNGIKTVYAKFRTSEGGAATVSDTIVLVSQSTDQKNGSCPLTLNHVYKSPKSNAVYYITEANNIDGTLDKSIPCTKRSFTSSKTYFTYFTSWNDVEIVTKEKLDNIPDNTLGFMPAGPKYDPKYGALVKVVTDPKVYLLLGGNKQWITSEAVFTGLNYAWNWIEDVAESLLGKYTSKGEITYTDHHPNYTLIKYEDDTKVYRLESNPVDESVQVKRHIADEATFNSLNFRWDRIVTVSDTEVYETGETLGESSSETTEEVTLGTEEVFVSFLEIGSEGEEVIALQQLLKQLGHFPDDIDANGFYGAITEQALKDFQSVSGIAPLGFVGPGTRAALNAL